jgi:hypothetical protein
VSDDRRLGSSFPWANSSGSEKPGAEEPINDTGFFSNLHTGGKYLIKPPKASYSELFM